jgi:CheY-like chemotaxis protein
VALAAPILSRVRADLVTRQPKGTPVGPLLLVVEDDDLERDVLGLILEAEGYDVRPAPNGFDALVQLQAPPAPLCIFLDLNLPVLGGRQFLRHRRRDPDLAVVPVLALSADTTAGPEAVALGAATFVAKPVDPAVLLAAVRRLCR